MGYCSDVGFALPLKKAFELSNKAEQEGYYNLFKNPDETENIQFCDETWIVYRWNYIKWYDSFPEVDLIESYMTDENPFCFIRLGEDYQDNELNHNNKEDTNIFYYSRYIEIGY